MIRDELMQRVVNREEEPIIPFIDRVSELYERERISTVLVAGSSGSYFHKADTVIQMKQYPSGGNYGCCKKRGRAVSIGIRAYCRGKATIV